MTKHYIRINEDNNLIKGFSDDFEQPGENDILINEDAPRQFCLKFNDGKIHYNPSMKDTNGCYSFKWDGEKVIRVDEEEKKNSREYREHKIKHLRAQRNGLLDRCDVVYCNADVWETYTAQQKQQIRDYKQQLRDLPEQIQDVENINFPTLEV